MELSRKHKSSRWETSVGGVRYITRSYDSTELVHLPLFTWIFDLLERNMRTMYESCDWGWNPKSKLAELKSKKAKYLIVFSIQDGDGQEEEPIGFVHFRYDMDYGRRVVYCYELQLEVSARGQGLGSWLMNLLEILGNDSNQQLIVLTVLKANESAIGFYKTLGYKTDETNPAKSERRPYFIYSKKLM